MEPDGEDRGWAGGREASEGLAGGDLWKVHRGAFGRGLLIVSLSGDKNSAMDGAIRLGISAGAFLGSALLGLTHQWLKPDLLGQRIHI